MYRPASIDDAEQLAEFAARLFTISYQHLMDAGDLADYVSTQLTVARKLEELRDHRAQTFLAIDDAIAGYAQVFEGNFPACRIDAVKPAELKRIYVDPAWHGHGVAHRLVELVETEARSRACDVLWLAVWEVNDRAIAFYRKSGFQAIGRQGFPIGSDIHTDYVMAKPLGK